MTKLPERAEITSIAAARLAQRHAAMQAKRKPLVPVSPLADSKLPDDPTIYLIRASSRLLKASDKNRGHQADSPENQKRALDSFIQLRGYNAPHRVFIERHSAKSFSKRAEAGRTYGELKRYISENPRADNATLVLFDVDRFTRELDENEKPDIGRVLSEIEWFRKLGWHVDFSTTPVSRDAQIGDYIILIAKAFAAADELRVKGIRQRQARVRTAERGNWICGAPPYPARRIDALTRRPLMAGEWTQNGSLLARDPALYPAWQFAAEKVAYEGWSCGQAAEALHAQGAPLGATMKSWSHHGVRRMLTNPALIAQPVVYLRDKGGVVPVEAKWEPVVDVALFTAANKVLAERQSAGRRASTHRDAYLLNPICEVCGAPYYPQDWQDTKRYPGLVRLRYQHRATSVRSGANSYDWGMRARGCGCRSWTFDAEPVHEKIRELIVAHRASPEFISDMLRLRRASADRVRATETQEQQAKAAWQKAEADYESFCQNIGQLSPAMVAKLESTLAEKERKVEQARRAWQLAREQTAATANDGGDILARIDQTKQILNVWKTADFSAKKLVFDWWIDAVLVKQGPLDRKKKTTEETVLLVALRTDPERPYALVLRGKQGSDFSKCRSYHPLSDNVFEVRLGGSCG